MQTTTGSVLDLETSVRLAAAPFEERHIERTLLYSDVQPCDNNVVARGCVVEMTHAEVAELRASTAAFPLVPVEETAR